MLIWNVMVIGNIWKSRNMVNSSAQGSEEKVTARHGAHFPAECARMMWVWNSQKSGERWITFILTISDFCHSSIINFRYPEFVCKMTTIGKGLLSIICKMLPKIQMYHKKVQIPLLSNQYSCYCTLCFCYFLWDIRIISGSIGAIALATLWHMPWLGNFCTVNLTDKVLSTCKPKFQKKESNFATKTKHMNSFLLSFFIWFFVFPIDIFVNGNIETPLKAHCVENLPVDERYNNLRARFFFNTHLWRNLASFEHYCVPMHTNLFNILCFFLSGKK